MTLKETIASYLSTLMSSPQYLVLAILVAILLLWLARRQAHKAILSLSRVSRNGLRLAAKSVLLAEQRVSARNKEVLLSAGREAVERVIEREFHRVDAVVRRDLGNFPALQRSLAVQITRIDEDYQDTSDPSPPPPAWIKAVEAVAKIPAENSVQVGNILNEIHKTTIHQFKSVMEEYRKTTGIRHALLNKMKPAWRQVEQTLEDVGKTVTGLMERSRVIDHRMAEFEEIRSRTDQATRKLTASATTQFFIAAFVLLVAVGGAVINFNLIALPMSEMVGGGSYIGNFKMANIAALVIILVEAAMGLYLMEALRITRLFPIIGHMDDKMRVRMIWITFGILLVLAMIESSLAFMRDQIATDVHALRQSLADAQIPETTGSWIPMVGQMVMGFILPFALTFVAIPLESFIHSSRTVFGIVLTAFMRGFAFFLRFLGNISCCLGEFFINLYDLFIFPFLWAENLIQNLRKKETIHTAGEET
jgi:hypothetical protein